MSLLLKLLIDGGVATWLIAALGAVVFGIIVERTLHFHRAQISVPEFLPGIINVLRRGNVLEAISMCDDTPGPVAQIVRAALRHSKEPAAQNQAILDVGLSEIPRLERRLKLLFMLAHLAPLLGFLGTVVGMIQIFQTMEGAGNFLSVKQMAGGIWTALLSSAAGLTVAIPAYGFYHHFQTRIEAILLDMEKAASEILFVLSEIARTQASTSPLPATPAPTPHAEAGGNVREPHNPAGTRTGQATT